MEIRINPNRIGNSASSKARAQSQQQTSNEPIVVPARSEVNYVPSVESLRTLISSAVAALRRGIYWDRGTILNLLV